MDAKKLAKAATPKKLAGYLVSLHKPMHHGHLPKGSIQSVRKAEHNGHRIVIRTTYNIEVDGRTVQAPLAVDNQGQVRCHSLPNYQVTSAVDMIKALIDNFPEDFAGQKGYAKRSGAHGEHAKPKHKKGG